MAQNVTFDLPNTTVPAGILKMQVTADITNVNVVTGAAWSIAGDTILGDLTCLFLSELKVGGMAYFNIGATEYNAVVSSVTDNQTAILATNFGVTDNITNLKILVFPITNFLIVMDEQVEKVDVKMGMYEYDEFTLEFAEDYSWYIAGFWYNLFRLTAGSPVTFFVRMEESGSDSFVTYGNVNLTSVEFNELALDEPNIANTNSKIRTCKLSIVSGLDKFKTIATTELIAEMLTYTVTLGGTVALSFNSIISVMIKNVFNQTFALTDLQVRNNDFQFVSNVDEAEYNYTDIHMHAEQGSGAITTYFDSGSYYLGDLYPTLLELLKDITLPFGLVPRHYYGQDDGTYAGDGSDRHHIELLTRGNCQAVITMEGEIIESLNAPYSPYVVTNLRASSRIYENHSNYFFNSSINPDAPAVKEEYGVAPNYINFDIDIVDDFIVADAIDPSDPFNGGSFLLEMANVGSIHKVIFYNYKTGATETVYSNDNADSLSKAVSRYFYYRFLGQATYTRTYSDVRSTVGGLTSQQNTRCLRRHTITDEFSARTFYAIEVRKSFINNTASVVWFQE